MIERLGPYRIERVLGRGGMGTVYAGTHEQTGQRAAIKALSHVLADDANFRDRFLAEIQTLKQLQHPLIVQLYGDGEQDGCLFYAMEFVEGRTLQEELQSGRRFGWQEVVQIAIEICQALKHAHDRGIIHRDLKPANLMRMPDGRIKLTDFGIARLFGATHLTADGSVVGTADYMSPEQAEGRPVTHHTDLYSLGNVMFTLLARRTPFTGPSLPQVIHNLRYEEPPLLRRFAPQVPAELEQIIRQLLSKNPENRIPTVLVLANRLKAMQHALLRGGASDRREEPAGSGSDVAMDEDQATRQLETDQGPKTEMAPTAVDLPDPVAPRADEQVWDAATVAKLEDQSGDAASSPASPSRVAELPSPAANRFTPLSVEDRAAADATDGAEPAGTGVTWQTIWLALALLAIVLATLWGLWPLSADTLYRRIEQISQEQGAEDARKYIEEFIERFPDDPRFAEVDRLRMDIECDWLQSRLALRELTSGGAMLEPYEREFLEAMRLIPKQPDEARQQLRRLLDEHAETAERPQSLENCLQAARHQLRRLDQDRPGP